MESFKATTIIAVKKDGKTAIAGDGQVTFGQAAIMKANARKVRRLYNNKVSVDLIVLYAHTFNFKQYP